MVCIDKTWDSEFIEEGLAVGTDDIEKVGCGCFLQNAQ